MGWYKIVDWTGISNFDATDFTALNLRSGLTGTFAIDDATLALYLNVVPEPGTVGLTVLAGAVLFFAVRRTRKM